MGSTVRKVGAPPNRRESYTKVNDSCCNQAIALKTPTEGNERYRDVSPVDEGRVESQQGMMI
jgi:hypothetical protein